MMNNNEEDRIIPDAGLAVRGGSYWLMGRRDLRLLRVGQKALRQKLYRENAESKNGSKLVRDRKGWIQEVNTVEDRLKKLHYALLNELEESQP